MKVSYQLMDYLRMAYLRDASKWLARHRLREVKVCLEHVCLRGLRRDYCDMLRARRRAQYARHRLLEIADEWLGVMILETEVAA